MKNSSIEWTDHTFNPWEGCTKVSPGCAHCYAEARNARFGGGSAPNWGPGAPRRRTAAANWKKPQQWNELGERATALARLLGGNARRQRVFCASLADWLDPEVPVEWLSDLLYLIAKTSHLDWQLLTKRPQLWRQRMEAVAGLGDIGAQVAREWLNARFPGNVWLGTTAEDQQRLDERMPELYEIPARLRFLSMEPLLGEVDLFDYLLEPILPQIDWVIVGGESGRHARPMDPDWARTVRDQCSLAGVPFFFKQWGGVHKAAAGRLLEGKEHLNFPMTVIQPASTL